MVWEEFKAMREGADICDTTALRGNYQRSNSQLKERSKVERIDCMCYTVHWAQKKSSQPSGKGPRRARVT